MATSVSEAGEMVGDAWLTELSVEDLRVVLSLSPGAVSA